MKALQFFRVGATFLMVFHPLLSAPLPTKPPEDLQIKFWKSPGHAGIGYKWNFSKKSCELENFNRSETISYKCTMTPEQWDLLYKTLQKYSIEKISIDPNIFANDYDAESIEIRHGNDEISVVQSGTKVRPSDMAAWMKIVDVFQREKNKLKVSPENGR